MAESLASLHNGQEIFYKKFLEQCGFTPDIRTKLLRLLKEHHVDLFAVLKGYRNQSDLISVKNFNGELEYLKICLNKEDMQALFKIIPLNDHKEFNLNHLCNYVLRNELPPNTQPMGRKSRFEEPEVTQVEQGASYQD